MDHRTVHLEVLREFARSMAEQSSIRAVAEDAGVGRSTVHSFITAGTTPHPRVRRLLALWFLRRLIGVEEVEILRPYIGALNVLLGDAPDLVREGITSDLLRAIESRYCEAGEDAPAWAELMRGRITRTRPVL